MFDMEIMLHVLLNFLNIDVNLEFLSLFQIY